MRFGTLPWDFVSCRGEMSADNPARYAAVEKIALPWRIAGCRGALSAAVEKSPSTM
jgi:hypothetical protein